MNRIFKVFWNKTLKRFVVTNEIQRSRRKAKNESIALGAALLTLLPLPFDSAFASNITSASGWNKTTIQTTGKLTKITTTQIQGDTANNKGIGINKFGAFTVTKGDIANLIVPDKANNLVNFVNDSISIDGTVNSLKGSKVGGNLFFVTPSGMTVGATGVINAGSLTAVVTTESAFDEWTGSLSKVDSALLNKMQSGMVPLNRSGVITVNGSINVGNRIVLAASKIEIGSKATLTNKRAVEDFKNLVNISDASGITASAGVDGTLEAKETTDGSGDILLFARTDTKDSSSIEAKVNIAGNVQSRGSVAAIALAGNGTFDDTRADGSYVFKTADKSAVATIKSTIDVSGKISADKDVGLVAKASNEVDQGGIFQIIKKISLEILGSTTGINEDIAYGSLTSVASVTVTKDATITALGNLKINALSDTYLSLGAEFSPVQLLKLEISEKIPAFAALIAFIDSQASVVINGSLETSGDLTIAAKDTLNGKVESSASHLLSTDSNPGHAAFTYAKFEGKSDVNVSNTARIKLNKKATESTGGDVSITSERTSRVDTSAIASLEREAYGAIALNYTEHNTSSTLTLNTGFEGESAKSLTIASRNTTERESMYAQTESGTIDWYLAKVDYMLKDFSEGVVSGLMDSAASEAHHQFKAQSFKVGGTVGVIKGTQSSTLTINAPGKTLKAAGNVTIESVSEKFDHHYTVYSQSSGKKSGDGDQEGEVEVAGAIGLLISLPKEKETVTSNLTIGDDVTVASTAGTLTVTNKADISYNRVKAMIEDLLESARTLKEIYTYHTKSEEGWEEVDKAIEALDKANKAEGITVETFTKYSGDLWTRLGQAFENAQAFFGSFDTIKAVITHAAQFVQLDSYVNSYVTSSGLADAGKVEFGGSLGLLTNKVSSNLTIGKGAQLYSGTAGATQAGWIHVTGESTNESVALTGHLKSIKGVTLVLPDDSSSFGAGVLVQILNTNNVVRIREGARLEDLTGKGAVKVATNDRIENITIGASADVSKGSFGISANVGAVISTGVNLLSIDDETTISGGSVTLQANRKDNSQTIVGTVSAGTGGEPSNNVGASLALNLIDFKNNLSIEDNDILDKEKDTDKYTTISGLIEAKSTDKSSWGVDISARQDTTLNAIGVSGGISTSGTSPEKPKDPPAPEEPEDPDSAMTKVKEFFRELGNGVKGAFQMGADMASGAVENLFTSAYGQGKSVGRSIRDTFKKNSEGNENLDNPQEGEQPDVNEQNMVDSEGNADIGEGNSDLLEEVQEKHFQIGMAASAAWNSVNLENKVTIAADDFTIATAKLNVEAVTDKWIGAWAGGVAISYVKKDDAQTSSSAGVGGAFAINSGTLTNCVTISEGLKKTGISLGNDTSSIESVTIRAVNDGTIIAEGLSAGIASTASEDGGDQYSFDASLSVNILDNTVKADVSSVTQKSTKELSWDQAAWNGETQVSGGTGLGLSLQENDKDSSRSVGLLVAYAEINNTVQSTAKSLTLVKANKFDLRALTNVSQVTTAVGVNVTTGESATSFTGSAAATKFINTVNAEVSNSTITLTDGAQTRILAMGITDDESSEFTKLSDWTAESKAADSVSSELDNADFYKEVVFQTEKGQTKEKGQKLSELGKKTGLRQTTVVVSTAVSAEKGSGAPAILVNKIDNSFTTSVESTTFSETAGTKTGSYTQRAESNATSVAVATGIAASPSGDESIAIAGSLIVSNVDQKSKTTVKKSSITADTVAIESGNDATTVNVAGDVGLSLSEKGDALGAAVLVMNTNNRAEITVEDSSILNTATLTTKALNNARAWGVSVDVKASKELAFGGSVAVNRVKNESVITVDGLKLKDFTTASFTADDTSNLWTLAGGVAYGGETAGASGAVAYSISGRGKSDGTKVDISNITVQKTEGKAAGDLTVKAEGKDKVHTLVLAAGVSKGKVGFSGASGVGEVKRETTATVKNLKTEMLKADGTVIDSNSAAVLGALSIKAIETAGVYNLGIAAAYADTLGLGVGIAVNRIATTTNASLVRDAVDESRIKAKTLEVAAKTSNDIENIAIGGAGSGNIAIMGSIVINKLTDNTKAELSNVKVDLIDGAASVDAQSDDVIGSYSGGVAGAKEGAGGLSILVNDRFGDTKALVSHSEVKQTGTPTKTLTAKGAVDKDHINDKIVNDISVAASLEKHRNDLTIQGIRVGATSTATFKSFVINGAGAGTGAGVGCATVNYHGGSTNTTVSSSSLEAVKEVTIESGNFVNVDNLLMLGAFAAQGAGTIAANVATTNHETTTEVDGGSLTSTTDKVKVSSESKEGVSSLGIALSGAQYGAGGILVNVTRELSDAKTEISKTAATTITGKNVEAKSDYLGRLNSLAVMASGAQYGAGVINVIVNYNNNDAITNLGKSKIEAQDSVTASSLRRTENSGIGVQLSGAQYGSLAATILVNTVEGDSKVTTDGAIIKVPILDSEAADGKTSPSITLSSAGEDTYDLVDVAITGAVYGSAGTLVVVNRFLATAQTDVETSTIAGDTVTIEAKQNRDIDANTTFVSGAFGTLGANVLSTIVGAGGDPFAKNKTNLSGVDETVSSYMKKYAAASSSDSPGILGQVQNGAGKTLTDQEKEDLLKVAATSASEGSKTGGTHVKVNGSEIYADSLTIVAKEDTESWAQKTLKVGEYSVAAVEFVASVGTLQEKRNLTTTISASTIAADEAAQIGTQIGGKTKLDAYQGKVAGIEGSTAFANIDIQGGSNVILDKVTFDFDNDGEFDIFAKDNSDAKAYTFGLDVALLSSESIVANIDDSSSVGIEAKGASTIDGNVDILAARSTERRAEVRAGTGGALNHQWTSAMVTDTGNTTVTLTGITSSGNQLNVAALNEADLYTKSYQGYASVLNLGVLESTTKASGKTSLTVTESALNSSFVTLNASSGAACYDANGKLTSDDALRLSAIVESYGASVAIGYVDNSALAENSTTTELVVTKNTYDETTSLTLSEYGYAYYDVVSDLGTGGVLGEGCGYAKVIHNASLTNTISSAKAGNDLGLFVLEVDNIEEGTLKAYGAGGTLIDLSANAAQALHLDTSSVVSNLSGTWDAKEGVLISNASTHKVDFLSENVKGVVLGGSSARLENSMVGTNSLTISGNWTSSEGSIYASAITYVDLGAVSGKTYAVDSAVYGVINGANATSKNAVSRDTTVNIAKDATITAKNDLDIASQTIEDSTLRVRARTAGLAAGVTAYNNNTVTENTTINVAENAKLKNLDCDYEVTLSASSSSTRVIDAIGDLQGAAVGGAGAKSVNEITQTNEVKTSKGSTIEGAGNVNLYAGRDISGDEEDFNFTVYTHAYAKSIGGTTSELEDTFNLTNRLTLSGDVLAVRSIDATADIGTWSLSEISRYWELLSSKDAAKVVRIASSAEGKKSVGTFNPVNSIVLNGKLTAGTQTKSIITLTGLVDPQSGQYSFEDTSTGETGQYKINGASDKAKETIDGIELSDGTITYGKESVANLYKTRYETLLNLIADFRGNDGDGTAILSYSKEAQILKQKMIDQGLAIFDGDKLVSLIEKDWRGVVKVSGITVAGGDVNLRADSVTGAGAITANAAETITIDNQTNLALTVENVRILEKGGNLTLNGLVVSSKPDQFSGSVVSQATAGDPTVKITSKYSGGNVRMTATKNDGTTLVKEITPDNTITVNGVVANDAGSLTVSAVGDIFVGGGTGSRLAAATTLSLSATRSVMQSYTSGIKDVAGGIETLWKEAVNHIKNDGGTSYNTGNTAKVPDSSSGIIAGEGIFISADNVNLNGLVQSGYALWTVDLTQADLEAKVSQIKDNWIRDGSKRDINPISNDYLISSGGHYTTSDGTYAMAVAVWYDPVNDRVIVDDIKPQGGHIYLTGRISSTGGGKLYAASGTADVSINAGNHSVRLGEITTKNGSGLIEITDTTDPGTSTSTKGNKAVAKVYRWENDGTTTTHSAKILYQDGETADLTGATITDTSFTPTAGLSYVWSDGYRTGKVETKETSQHFLWWSAWDSGDPDEWRVTSIPEDKKDEALGSGRTLAVGLHKDSNYKFNSWVTTTTASQGEWQKTDWVTYDNWTHFSGDNHSKAVRTTTGTKINTYSVKADEKVDVGFLKASNKVDVTSAADIVLTGKLSAQEGTVNLTAQRNIINDDSDASIIGAKTLNLKAGAAIGEENSAIKIVNSKGAISLSAVGSMENAIYLDATNTQEGAVINASDLTARDVILTARGTVNVTNLTAYEANLVSNAGDIVVSNLDQKNATDDIVRRFDAKALNGSVTLTATGDIGIGKIVAGNAVTVTSTGGNVWDALYRDDLDERNAEEKLRVWKEAGILNTDGTNNGETRYNADVTAQEDIVKADFKRYEEFMALSEEQLAKLNDNQTKDFNSLKARFSGIASADAAVEAEKANANSNLAKTIAARDNYGWSQTELLYAVSKAIVNPDSSSAPEAGDTNIEAKTISIKASQSAGIELDTKTFKYSEIDASTDEGMEAYKVLARADIDDVVWDKDNESVTVTLKRPISVKLTDTINTSRLDGTASKGFYVASDEKLRVGNIDAAGATVRLTSLKGIEALAESLNIYAKDITLRGGNGSVGSSTNPVIIRSTGSVALSGEEGIHIKELNGELKLVSAATEGVLDLTAEKILSVFEESQGAEGYLSAKTIVLNGNDDAQIGTEDTALRIKVRDDGTSSITVNRSKFETFNLEILGEGDYAFTLKDNTLETTDNLTLTSEGNLTVADNTTLKSTGTLTLDTGESLTIKDSATLQANVLVLRSEGEIVADSATFKPLTGESTVTISASDSVSLKNAKFEDDEVSLTVASENGSVNFTRTDATSPMKVKKLQIDAGSAIHIVGNSIESSGDIKLDAGQAIQASGATLKGKGNLSINADIFLVASDATFTSTDTFSLTSEGEIQASGLSVTSNGETQICATESVDLQNAAIDAGDGKLTVSSETGTVNLSQANTFNEVKAKEILISSKNVNLAGRTAKAKESLIIKASGSIDAPRSTLVAKAGELNLKGDYTINLKLARLNSENGSLTLASSKSRIDAFMVELQSKGQVTIDAQGNADLTRAIVTSKDSSILVNAKTAGLEAYFADFKAENGNLTIFAESDTNLKDARFKVSSTGLLSITTNSGDLDLSSSSTQELYANQLTVQSGSNVNLKSRDVATNGALLVKAAGSIEATYSLKSQTTLTLEGDKGIFVNGGNVTSQEKLALTSSYGRIEAQGATLKSETDSVYLAASDIVSANSVTVESLGGALNIAANRGMSLDGANLTSNADVTLTSANGYMKAAGLTLNTPTALSVTAQNEVQLKDAKFSQMSGTIHIASSKGDVGVAASSEENDSIFAKNLILEAGRNIDFRGRKAHLGEEMQTSRSRMLRASIPDDATGLIVFESGESIYVDDATLTGSSIDLNSAAGDLLARNANLTSSGKFTLAAGDDIDVSATTLNSASENLILNSEYGNVYAKSATLTSPVEIDIAANKDISLSGTTSLVDAAKVTLTSEFGVVDLSDSVQVIARKIDLTAEAGDILLAGNASLTAQDGAVNLDAGDDIVQRGDSLIKASSLNATANASIYLGSSSGNEVPEVTLNTVYGSVALNTAVDTTVSINEGDYPVNGDIWLDAFDSSLTLEKGATAAGQISVHAKSFKTGFLVSDDGVYVSTNLNSDEPGTFIEIDEIVSSEIGLMTDKASIKVDKLNAFDGSATVCRTSLETGGTIYIGESEATSNGFIYNGNGNITSGLVSDECVQILTGKAGTVTQLPNTRGSSSYVMHKASYLTKSLNAITQDKGNEYKWFPMIDWRKLGYTYVARATDVAWGEYHFEMMKLTKPFSLEEDVIEDNWSASLDSPEIEGLSVF